MILYPMILAFIFVGKVVWTAIVSPCRTLHGRLRNSVKLDDSIGRTTDLTLTQRHVY